MNFLRTEVWILLAAPLLALLLWAFDRARRRRFERTVGRRATALASGWSPARLRARRTLFGLALLLALLAVLQPAWGDATDRLEHLGVDILVCLDVSRSMLARDVSPSRLLRAHREIAELAEHAAGDRIGLVIFSGEAKLAVPLTRDMRSLKGLLELAVPLSVGRGGTDLGAALDAALGALSGATGEHEVVLLLTDGEDHQDRGLRAAQACRDAGITVHTVGVGTARGAKIPVRGETGERFLRNRAGNEVVSALDPTTLRRIADAAGGVYTDGGLVDLYEDRILPMARKSFQQRERRERENRYQWPLSAAFLLWIVELCVSDRKR